MISESLNKIKSTLSEDVMLVAVSKTHPAEVVLEAYNAGQRIFGENKVQELCEKQELLPKDIQWHLIGHLQTNKVKFIAPFVSMIHSIDSLRLLAEVNKQALKNDRIIECLLQFHIASEDTKYGLSMEETMEMLESEEFFSMRNISVVGLMGMATFTDDTEQIREEFRTLENYFNVIQSKYFKFNPGFKHLSMGMSSDYLIAVEEGSTMVRVGSSIFGSR